MLTNANHQTPDQRPSYSSAPTELPTPLDRRPYWNETIAAFSDSVWLPTGTADRGAAINRPHGWSSKTAAHSWFSTSRIAAPNPDLPRALLASRSAVHNQLLKSGRYTPAVAPDSGLSGPRTEGDHHHLADRQPLDLQPHSRDPAVWHPGRMEIHRQHGNAGSQSAAFRMGFRPLPGEAHGSQGRLPGP